LKKEKKTIVLRNKTSCFIWVFIKHRSNKLPIPLKFDQNQI